MCISASQFGSNLPGELRPVGKSAFYSWELESRTPDPCLRIRHYDLVLSATIFVKDFKKDVQVLIDTGSRVPILFREKLIPREYLSKASQVLNLVTADSTPMGGGKQGCHLRLTLPFFTGRQGDPPEKHFGPFWGYESAIQGSDIILGYKFLAENRLIVDCPSDILRDSPFSNSGSSPTTFSSSRTFSRKVTVTPSPKSPTHVNHRGGRKNPTPLTCRVQGVGSSSPIVSPGNKTKATGPKDISELSSHPDPKRQQPPPHHSFSECDVQLPPSTCLLQSPTDVVVSGSSECIPSFSQPPRGDGASTKSFGTPTPLLRCTQCHRVTSQSNFDCGCVTGSHTLIPVQSEFSSDLGKAADPCAFVSEVNVPPTEECYESDGDDESDNPCPDYLQNYDWVRTDNCLYTEEFSDTAMTQPIIPATQTLTIQQTRLAMKSGNYRISQSVFDSLRQKAVQMDLLPEVDAFSSRAHARMPSYWSAHSNAFKKCWKHKVLWIHPMFNALPRILEKIHRDRASGMLLVPVRKNSTWFQDLSKITFYWENFPTGVSIFEDPKGHRLLPWRNRTFRVAFFNACQGYRPFFESEKGSHRRDEKLVIHSIIHSNLNPTSHETRRVSGVIESAQPHPKAITLESELRKKYEHVMEHPVYAKDIDPKIRGPFGVCKIELKEGAKPMHKKFFRCSGEREEALNKMIQKLISRGWIVPSKSEWTSQAFVVPKPADASGNKQWRLVLDYRYLNSQTKDDPFPFPSSKI